MTVQVNMAEAKARLSELVSRAEAGEDVVIARAGRPAVELRVRRPAARPNPRRVQVGADPEFDELLARAKAKHPFIGALAHLGPLTEEEATLFLGPDPEMERLARSEDEDEFYR